MKVTLLVLHRKEHYEGEYAPEVMSCVDEVTLDDNPEWWPTEVKRQRDLVGDDASAWAEITVDVPRDAIMAALYPKQTVLPAAVVGAKSLPGLLDGADPTKGDARIGVGSYVISAEEYELDGVAGTEVGYFGFVASIQDGGYGVIWHGEVTPKFAAYDEVAHVDEPDVPKTFTRN